MTSNLDRFRKDLDQLIERGEKMRADLYYRETLGDDYDRTEKDSLHFEQSYQDWYSESYSAIKQLLPDRISEFESLYLANDRRKELNLLTYKIQDWIIGTRSAINNYSGEKHFNDSGLAINLFNNQLGILTSVKSRFESSLFDIEQLVRADLFDSELDAATELLKNRFLRGAGAIAGVVLEKHLSQVCSHHNITIRKKNPSINDYNDAIKNKGVIDVPIWRNIQRLADLRNLCDHNKERDPTKDEVDELITGTEKITKTLF
jgi:hypothetical protein